ncbi:hypothetical protein LAZ67_5003087 [Cordylochernes scorpioides]|uniref:Reverse transcriptase Ty1/copia-type domain-containing protein n=1 Tax=Cordylochernes scorpioides TaxID=51811 RepID=A0ABY6KGZ3_9ARAC|nr:hypothetical protein LAZ67_5003087 [Cordylochernes scorpioides]
MDQPEGYIHIGTENLVCKLKSIYGLKQSARSWYQKINKILRTLGFSQAKIWVMRATHYLGILLEKDIDGNILLHQKLKILRILDKYGMSSSNGVSTPMEVGYSNIKENILLPSNEKYRKLIGELMYIANCTRPGISSAIGTLSRRVVKPNEYDWKALKRILGYLKSTLDLVLVFETSSSVELTGYTDADWEAEYVAAATAAQEAIWLDLLMSDFGFEIKKPIILNEDNQITAKTKHIDIKFHFIKDLISNNFLSLNYCPTEKMLADIFNQATS